MKDTRVCVEAAVVYDTMGHGRSSSVLGMLHPAVRGVRAEDCGFGSLARMNARLMIEWVENENDLRQAKKELANSKSNRNATKTTKKLRFGFFAKKTDRLKPRPRDT